MTYEQKLTRAVQTAKDNGWKFFGLADLPDFTWGLQDGQIRIFGNGKTYFVEETRLLFEHSFGAALFGSEDDQWADDMHEDEIEDHGQLHTQWQSFQITTGPAYLYHFQQMVILTDRLTYINEYLDDRAHSKTEEGSQGA